MSDEPSDLAADRPALDGALTAVERPSDADRLGGAPSLAATAAYARPGGERAPGALVGAYRIVRPIASGGFGTVYEAVDTARGTPVAVKVLHADAAASSAVVARFELEARLVALIRHPNVVELLDVGQLDDGRPYLVTELLRGEDLRERLARGGPVSLATALELLAPLCDALDVVHAHGVVHRDLKPSNVFLADEAGATRVVLLDFGVAKLLGEGGPSLTRSRQVVGTPMMMSPEQIRGEPVDARADVYALGFLAFVMLTGRAPYDAGSGVTAQYQQLYAEPLRPSHVAAVDPRVDEVVLRAMAKDAAHRFPTAGAFLASLRVACAGPATPAGARPVAVAVVSMQVPPADLADPSDELVAVLDRVLCEGATVLTAAGFETIHEGVDRLVLRRALDAASPVRAALEAAAAHLASLPAASLPWSLRVHVGAPGTDDDPLDLARWLEPTPPPGLALTPTAARLLGWGDDRTGG